MSSSPGTTLRVPTLPGHDFNLPAELEGLDDLAYNLWWSWTPRRRRPLLRLDPAAWARHRNPIAVLAGMDAGPLGGRLRRRGVPGRRQPRAGRVPPLHGQRQRLVVPAADRPDRARFRADRLLLRRVRHPRVDADLLRRPGRPGRRPLQVGVRCGAAVHRRRPPLPPWLLPPADRRRWAPGARPAGPRPLACSRCAGRAPPTARRCRSASTSPTARSTPRCGWRRWARADPAARHRHARQRPGRTGPSPTSSTCAAARCASARS